MVSVYDEFDWMLQHGHVLHLQDAKQRPLLVGRRDALAALGEAPKEGAPWLLLHAGDSIPARQPIHLLSEVARRVSTRVLQRALDRNRYAALFPVGCSLGWAAPRIHSLGYTRQGGARWATATTRRRGSSPRDTEPHRLSLRAS